MVIPSPPGSPQEQHLKGVIDHQGQQIGYTLYIVDARPPAQRQRNDAGRCLDGNLNIFLPGHGQLADTARLLIHTMAAASQSHLVWSIDIRPPRGGDPVKGEALAAFIRQRIAADLFPATAPAASSPSRVAVTVTGWSHGGGEALWLASAAGDLVEELVLLCPGGMVERGCAELTWSFILECLRIFFHTLFRTPRLLGMVFTLIFEIIAGVLGDLLATRSFRRLVEDICWICVKVPSAEYSFNGNVVILFCAGDSVIRWRDVFPSCRTPREISAVLEDYRQHNFPRAHKLVVDVLPGNHASPETDPQAFFNRALEALG